MKKLIFKLVLSIAVLMTSCLAIANEGEDSENLIFLYMNGEAGNKDLAKDAFIINSGGKVLHKWDNSAITASEGSPGYLTPDGLFLRGILTNGTSPTKFAVGVWGKLQLVDWDGTVVWEYDSYNRGDKKECFHHDVSPMPNGNILATAYRLYTEEEAQAEFGWQPTGQGKVLVDIIYELKPNLVDGTTEIVWKWCWSNHVVQQHDNTLSNYGEAKDHPEKASLHYFDSKNVMIGTLLGSHTHINSIDYNPDRDEIVFSSMTYDEIYVIDHSTTTAEAATSTGGTRGKGGDFLYRWGNPEAYEYNGGQASTYSSWNLTDAQHDTRWLFDGSGNITIHNNHSTTDPKPSGKSWTQFFEIQVPYNPDGSYTLNPNEPYGPAAPPTILAEYDPDNPLFTSIFAGGAQKLANGHIFSSSASEFTLLEHNENREIVWFFDLNNLKDPSDEPGGEVYKAQKYPKDYSGFDQLRNTLTVNNGTGSGSYIEWTEVAISATVPSGKHFVNWTGDIANIADANAASTTVTMPASQVTVTANFADGDNPHSADTDNGWSISQSEVSSFIALYNNNNNTETTVNGDLTSGRITVREVMRVVYLYNNGGAYIGGQTGTIDSYDIAGAQSDPAPGTPNTGTVGTRDIGDGSLVVSTTADSGVGSLRDAIAVAGYGETVIIDGSVDTITLLSEIVIDKSITIDGQGVAIVSGDKQTRVFRIKNETEAIDVTIKNIGIVDAENNSDEFGGAVYNNGQTLTLDTVLLDGNTNTTEDGKGGAVYNSGTLNVENCLFQNNTALEENDIFSE